MPGRGRGRPSRTKVYERLDHALRDMDSRFGGLPTPLEAEAIWHDIYREEVHNSTAIEGNTLVQREVNDVLDRGVTGHRSKALSEYLEVTGYGEAARWIYGQGIDPRADWSTGDLLTMHDVRTVHALTVELAWRIDPPEQVLPGEGPGQFRQHDIASFSGGMTPPSHTLVAGEVELWLRSVNALREDHPTPLIERVAATHARFEQIHPFLDGNGRAGRLLLNLVLVRLGLPPAIVYTRDRQRYLRALQRADDGDLGALAELLARAVLHNLNRLMLPRLAGPARLVPIASLANELVSHSALRSAAARGVLKAVQDELGQWMSSQTFVEEYLAQRNSRRGRPRRKL